MSTMDTSRVLNRSELGFVVADVVGETEVFDLHTHLYPTSFGNYYLSGIDELLTYHYLVAEALRYSPLGAEAFWGMDKKAQADFVWKTLFVHNSPISEATRGVITVISTLGLDPNMTDLIEARQYFENLNREDHVDLVMKTARVTDVVMTNDPFDSEEAAIWEAEFDTDSRFHAALRLDRLLNSWPETSTYLADRGYSVDDDLGTRSVAGIRKYLDEWIDQMKPLYMAVSLPDDFQYPAQDIRDKLLKQVILPIAQDRNLPVALMIGVRRAVNPVLRGAGDGVGRADASALERICVENPGVKFFATFLSRENQHELCVAARKFDNLMPFGCWWFLNNPSMIKEITQERLELLGTSFIPQHSDSRVLEQLIYKWSHSRKVIADSLTESYGQLFDAGGTISRGQIERDVAKLFSGNFRSWVGIE